MPDTIADHLPAQVGRIFTELETIGRGKFVNFVFPDLEQEDGESGDCRLPTLTSGFRFDGGIVEGTGTTEQVEQEGLYLVIGVVGQEERRSRKFLRGSGKKLESGFSRGSFEGTGSGQLGQVSMWSGNPSRRVSR